MLYLLLSCPGSRERPQREVRFGCWGGRRVITLIFMFRIEGTTSGRLGFVVGGGRCVITLQIPCPVLIEQPER